MKKTSSLFILFFTCTSLNCAFVKANSASSLFKREKEILQTNKIPKKNISFHLVELDQNKIVRSYQPSHPMIPASLTKVITTFMALKTLGPKKTFQTTLSYTGKVQGNTLEGNLYLKGNGAPTFGKRELFNLALSLKKLGINSINGNFFYDDTSLPNIKKLSAIGLGDQTYNPSINALSIDFNQFLLLKNQDVDIPLVNQFIPVPNLKNFDIQLVDETFTPGLRFRYQEDGSLMDKWSLSIDQNYSKSERLPLRNPSFFAANLFQEFAKKLGIQLPSPVQAIAPKQAKVIAKQEGLPLIRLVESNLEYSNNLLAELLLFQSLKEQGLSFSSLKDAGKLMKDWLSKSYPEMGWEQASLINGSGLTIHNRVSAKTLTSFLQSISGEEFEGRHYWSLLPMAGRASWLKYKLNHPDLIYNVWTKTGSLDYANNLTGYLITKSGKKIAFTILVNDKEKRFLIENSPADQAEELKKQARSWKKTVDQVHGQLLKLWINHY